MATLLLTLFLHFAGLTAPATNQHATPTTATQSIASQADGGSGTWPDR